MTSGAATMVVGVLLVATSAIVFGDAIALRPSSEPLGPAAFPLIIAVLLALVGIALVVSNRRSALVLARNITREGAPQLARVLILLGSIVVYALVLPIAGFTVTSALLFTVAARLLGSTHRWRLPLYGIVISGLITLLFDRLIGLALPAGPWGF
ncbi:tripartite tricarboxylate transporter TctB family protein [Cryobacterium sp. Y57]|uniref:tripartite tricarboxylate transporter TctB family protein n=1 Tax=Cryobacterium sp. Y57 TaxID=2048287 RepID=UPI001304A5CE|nr:tripartite tricarboxylate transporter TctB family protein [Cryobacterium sp. Y57]